jgi:hypothetical protein
VRFAARFSFLIKFEFMRERVVVFCAEDVDMH